MVIGESPGNKSRQCMAVAVLKFCMQMLSGLAVNVAKILTLCVKNIIHIYDPQFSRTSNREGFQ